MVAHTSQDRAWPPRRSPRRLPVLVSPRNEPPRTQPTDHAGPFGVSPRLQSSSQYGHAKIGKRLYERDKQTRSMSELLHQLSEQHEPLPESGDDVFLVETAAPLVGLPHLVDFRDVLKVIDARERVLQNIKTFLASMMFIRGNARSLPPAVLRRGRAKLAWLLARQRVHATNVVELVQLWRMRFGAPLPAPPLTAGAASAANGRVSPPPAVPGSGRVSPAHSPRPASRELEELTKLTKLAELEDGAAAALNFEERRQRSRRSSKTASPAPEMKSKGLVSAEAAAAAAGAEPPKPRVAKARRPEPAEPFLWMGCNYLLKMRSDLRAAPLPMGSDPLLLTWFHYESTSNETMTREEALRRPPVGGADASWAEQEWWFDAERLHAPNDLQRMREAHDVILAEATTHGLDVSEGSKEGALATLERAGNDTGREMEVLLYGFHGGYHNKLYRHQDATVSAIKIQSLYNAFSFARRVKQRKAQRRLSSIIFIQRSYRNRIQVHLSDGSAALASLIKTQADKGKEDKEAREALARAKAEEQAKRERRSAILRRRWVAVRSCVREYNQRKMSAIRLQCLVRAHVARRRVRHSRLEAKSKMREMNSGEAGRLNHGVMAIQSRFRGHRSCTAMLLEQYEQVITTDYR